MSVKRNLIAKIHLLLGAFEAAQWSHNFNEGDEAIAAARNALINFTKPPRTVKLDKDDLRFFDNAVGIVQASRFERHALWFKHAYKAKELGAAPMEWQNDPMGFGIEIGSIDERPIFVAFNKSKIQGKVIIFYEVTSTVVDHEFVREWLNDQMPKLMFGADKRLNHEDADNFHDVLR